MLPRHKDQTFVEVKNERSVRLSNSDWSIVCDYGLSLVKNLINIMQCPVATFQSQQVVQRLENFLKFLVKKLLDGNQHQSSTTLGHDLVSSNPP